MKNRDYYLMSAALAAASTAALVAFAINKAKRGKTYAALLLAGIAGLTAGVVAATEPTRIANRALTVEDLLDDEDTDLMQVNISEIFGNSADRGVAPQKLRSIEIDEEATIADFE